MKILFLLPSLKYGSSAKQALLLGRRLAGTHLLHVCVLEEEGAWGEDLRRAGVAVDCLHWRRPLDPTPLWRLRSLLTQFDPERIHVWRTRTLRSLALVGRAHLPRTVVSHAWPAHGPRATLGRLDRWLLGRVGMVIAGGQAEADRLRTAGLPSSRIVVVRPGVEAVARGTAWPGRNVRPTGRGIACLGPLEERKGFRDALWAADFLFYPFQDLHLWLVGEGGYQEKLRTFAMGALWHPHRFQFLGVQREVHGLLSTATACWVPSLTAAGTQAALEAQAAGCPVVASDLPHLREIIVDGETGLLAPPGDKMALAVKTRHLLVDPAVRQRLGDAGRERTRKDFSAERFVDECRAIYDGVASW